MVSKMQHGKKKTYVELFLNVNVPFLCDIFLLQVPALCFCKVLNT